MGFVKREAAIKTKTSITKQEFELAKQQYLKKIKQFIKDAKILEELISIGIKHELMLYLHFSGHRKSWLI